MNPGWLGGSILIAALTVGCGQVDLPSTEGLSDDVRYFPADQAAAALTVSSRTARSNNPSEADPTVALEIPRANAPATVAAVAARRLPPQPLALPRAPVEALDLSFVSDDFVAALSMRPRELLAAPLMAEFVPADQVTAWAAGFALDPRQVDHALILAGTPHAKTGPAVGLVLRCRTPFDRAKIVAALAPQHDEVLYGDKTYLRNREFSGQSVYFAGDHTLVVAQQVQLERMLRAAGEQSPLVDRLRQVDASAPLVALLAFDPIRELVQEELARSPALPPPFDQFDSLPEHLAAVELRLDPEKLPLITIALEGRDAEAAARLDPLARSGLAVFRGWLLRGAAESTAWASWQAQRQGRRVLVALGTNPASARDLAARLFAATSISPPRSAQRNGAASRVVPVSRPAR